MLNSSKKSAPYAGRFFFEKVNHKPMRLLPYSVLTSACLLFASFHPISANAMPPIGIKMKGSTRTTGGDAALTFNFYVEATNNPGILRYQRKLDGVEQDWQEPSDVMRLVVTFHGDENKLLATEEANFGNTSAGWTGYVESSPMIPGNMTLEVPADANNMLVTLTSAGPADALGTLAMGDLRVMGIDTNGTESTLYQLAFPANWEFDKTGAPLNAHESGINRAMAQIVRATEAPTGYALAILDTDKTSHADWQTTWIALTNASFKDVRVEWKISHSIGLADKNSIVYSKLIPGSYCLRVKPISALGQPLGDETVYPFEITTPFWEDAWFRALALLMILGGVFEATRYYYKQRARRIIERLEQQQAVERERMRIARDIHDDLGSTLAQISMLSQPLAKEATLDDAKQMLAQISSATVDMSVTMDEIVWTLNPTKDRLDHLLNYLDNYAQEFLSFSKINFRFDCPTSLPQVEISSTRRHNLFLAYKEALTNALKYSGCTEIRVYYEQSTDGFTISVLDDGEGFDLDCPSIDGNGLGNMRQRLADIGGLCQIESAPGKGTTVRFIMKD